jgi:hypothetical protein
MQSVSIVGERRIGKSSLLFHLKQTYPQWLSQPACYCFAYIDLQSARHDTLPDLLNGILKELLDCAHPADRAWQECVRHSGLSRFDDFLNTLDHWWNEITNYFANRDSSGFVEGLNNKLKVLKRRCYGLFNLGHLFQRIFLDLEGYRLFA